MKTLKNFIFVIVFTLIFYASSILASSAPIENPVTVNFSVKSSGVITARFNISSGWHIYGPKAPAIGLPTQIELNLPPGWSSEAWKWPKQTSFKFSGQKGFGYTSDLIVKTQLIPPQNESDGPITISGRTKWLACKEACIPGEMSFMVEISDIKSAKRTAGLTLLLAVTFAFIGGLILNLMPCVFPVVALKILNFTSLAQDRSQKPWLFGLSFSFGVLLSFWILATLMGVLQFFGLSLGWGFQLQSPIFVGILTLIFFILTLNLFGVFEMGVGLTRLGQFSLKSRPLTSTFLTGILAVVVATPCTAPFMGAALGFAVFQPFHILFLIFTSLGLGMAAPYLILSMFPAWLSGLPKPGQWMIYLKRFFAVLMGITTVWLGWIFFNAFQPPKTIHFQNTNLNWQTYSEKEIQQWVKEGKPVFIDFSAKWCLSCQVNETIVFSNPDVQNFLKDSKIILVKADWTHRDEVIANALRSYGRNGIPTYVWYPPNSQGRYLLLPEILTPQIFLKNLESP